MARYTSIELCSGAGGQALGIEQAGFDHSALVELDPAACSTLRHNRPNWNVIEQDLKSFSAIPYRGVDPVAASVPCPPFSKAGKQLRKQDDRDLFPEALRIVRESQPKAVMLENVRGIFDSVFDNYRLRRPITSPGRRHTKRQLLSAAQKNMAAMIQGFPSDWEFVGKKTPAYRQVGNAFPPPVAKAVALQIEKALTAAHILIDRSKAREYRHVALDSPAIHR
ncbi:MAG: hypothetical protein A2583_06370 [Bdellovibrionales bacterium RIFOXYD1_FULL_53_11]|nr:MAG: hypothetical protein A2583_06370 [Bdellovibrionales bacterium RIFOXYD1_FULL_53_11]